MTRIIASPEQIPLLKKPALIAVDGGPGAGKTTFAKKLASRVNASRVSLDEFIDKNHDDHTLNLPVLRTHLKEAGLPTVVEGVMVLKHLESVGVRPNFVIYVKRFDGYGSWQDEEEFGLALPYDVVIAEIEGRLKRLAIAGFGSGKLDEFNKAVIKYHYDFDPVREADFEMCWTSTG